MTDHPMLFSPPMVRALLEGRKTQTRRLLRPRKGVSTIDAPPCPYAPGDRIWVRERHKLVDQLQNSFRVRARYDDGSTRLSPDAYPSHVRISSISYRPGIHMPRWMSRLTLTITEVRVQRVQEISEEDAIAEGCLDLRCCERPTFVQTGETHGWPEGHEACCGNPIPTADPVVLYQELWDNLNAKRAPWADNPWVAAITFTVEQRNIDAPPPRQLPTMSARDATMIAIGRGTIKL